MTIQFTGDTTFKNLLYQVFLKNELGGNAGKRIKEARLALILLCRSDPTPASGDYDCVPL